MLKQQIITVKGKEQLDFSIFQQAIINHIETSSNILKYQNRQINLLSDKIRNNDLFIKGLDTLKNLYENEIISDNNLKNAKTANNNS